MEEWNIGLDKNLNLEPKTWTPKKVIPFFFPFFYLLPIIPTFHCSNLPVSFFLFHCSIIPISSFSSYITPIRSGCQAFLNSLVSFSPWGI